MYTFTIFIIVLAFVLYSKQGIDEVMKTNRSSIIIWGDLSMKAAPTIVIALFDSTSHPSSRF